MLADGVFDSPAVGVIAFSLAGFSLGMGLVLGAFVARALRRYMEDEDYQPYSRRRRRRRDDDET
jgi:hypothetical protein